MFRQRRHPDRTAADECALGAQELLFDENLGRHLNANTSHGIGGAVFHDQRRDRSVSFGPQEGRLLAIQVDRDTTTRSPVTDTDTVISDIPRDVKLLRDIRRDSEFPHVLVPRDLLCLGQHTENVQPRRVVNDFESRHPRTIEAHPESTLVRFPRAARPQRDIAAIGSRPNEDAVLNKQEGAPTTETVGSRGGG